MSRGAVIAIAPSPVPWPLSWEQGGAVPEQDKDPYLDTAAVAEQANVGAATVREYLKRSRRRVAAEKELRPQDLPLPDITIRRSPAWRQSTITAWLANRPKPGRPRSTGA